MIDPILEDALPDPFCARLGLSLDSVAVAIESFADGEPADIGSATEAIEEMFELLLKSQEVILRMKAGTLTQAEARAMCVPAPNSDDEDEDEADS